MGIFQCSADRHVVLAAPRDSPCQSDNIGISLDLVQGDEFIDNLLGCHNKDKFPSKFLNSRSVLVLLSHCGLVLNNLP